MGDVGGWVDSQGAVVVLFLSFLFAGSWMVGDGDGNGRRVWSSDIQFSTIMHAEVVLRVGSQRIPLSLRSSIPSLTSPPDYFL